MSWDRFGITNDTVGRPARSPGNRRSGRLSDVGAPGKSVHGTCLRAYSPLVQAGDPVDGRSSLYPAKDRFAVIRSAPRFRPWNDSGQASEVTPCVLPENRAR